MSKSYRADPRKKFGLDIAKNEPGKTGISGYWNSAPGVPSHRVWKMHHSGHFWFISGWLMESSIVYSLKSFSSSFFFFQLFRETVFECIIVFQPKHESKSRMKQASLSFLTFFSMPFSFRLFGSSCEWEEAASKRARLCQLFISGTPS